MNTRSVVALTAANVVLAAVVHLAWTALPSGAAVKNAVPLSSQTEEERLIGVIAKASPAVVSIVVEAVTSSKFEEVGRGTGFLVSADGMIVTNRHVASDRVSKYTAFLTDGRSFQARVLDIDPANDLALLKIDAKGVPFLTISPNDNLRIGQVVIVIGNALGKYENTVTRGILSGIDRSVAATNERTGRNENLEDILQTDAAINSGNSGGPMIDSSGLVIGVSTAVEKDGNGLGFSIPASEVRKVLSTYARYGAIARPRLGVRYVMITPEIALQLKLAYKEGALVQAHGNVGPGVVPNGPAAVAGLREGDIILEADGKKLAGKLTLSKVVQSKTVGDQLRLKIARGTTILERSVPLDAFAPVSP